MLYNHFLAAPTLFSDVSFPPFFCLVVFVIIVIHHLLLLLLSPPFSCFLMTGSDDSCTPSYMGYFQTMVTKLLTRYPDLPLSAVYDIEQTTSGDYGPVWVQIADKVAAFEKTAISLHGMLSGYFNIVFGSIFAYFVRYYLYFWHTFDPYFYFRYRLLSDINRIQMDRLLVHSTRWLPVLRRSNHAGWRRNN